MSPFRFSAAIAAYVVPTFALGVLWHLVWFGQYYADLQIYREQLIFPLGIASMLIQGTILAWLYPRISGTGHWLRRAAQFGSIMGILFWSLLVLPVAAKNIMASVPDFMLVETAFCLLQFAITAPLIALVYATIPAQADPHRMAL